MIGNPAVRRVYFCICRELWENRWLYLAPLAAACVFFVGFLFAAAHLLAGARSGRYAIALPYDMGAGLLMLTAMVVGAFYSVDALYGERRDRSILFWKSMPVSDATAVLSKASIPIVFLPLLVFAVAVVLHIAMLFVSSTIVAASGASVAALWADLSFPRMTALLLYHMLAVHSVWEAPLYAYLLLVSAWARRAPILWAVLPPVALATLEKLVLGTSRFADMINDRLSGGGMDAHTAPGTFPMDPTTHITIGRLLTAPGLWLGIAATALLLAAAIRLRRVRGPAA